MPTIITNFLDISYLGFSIFEILFFFLVVFVSFISRAIFANFVLNKIRKLKFLPKRDNVDKFLKALQPPLKFLPIVLIFFFFTIYLDIDTKYLTYFKKVNQTLFSIFIFWFLHNSVNLIFYFSKNIERVITKELKIWLTSSLRYLLIFLAIVAVLETWGIKIGPILAGLGLFGVALALGAQDMFKNLISGILILLEKSFSIGDVVKINDYDEGTVEYIGFRSTKIRKFDSSVISIPNYFFSESPIINYSKRPFRRIFWTIGLEYKSSLDQIKIFSEKVNEFISTNDKFTVDENFPCYVRLEKFNNSSIDILVYCFTNTIAWDEYLKIREELAYFVKKTIDSLDLSFAYPSQSIYIEKNDLIK